MNHGTKWTPQQDAALIARRQAGETLGAIADGMGRSIKSVGERVRRLGIAERLPEPYTPEVDAIITSMLARGENHAEIGRAVGRSKSAIGNRICALGLARLEDVCRLPAMVHRDAVLDPARDASHVAACLKQGGFKWRYSEGPDVHEVDFLGNDKVVWSLPAIAVAPFKSALAARS